MESKNLDFASRLMKQVLWPFRWYIVAMLSFACASAIDLSLRPYLMKLVVDTLGSCSAEKTLESLSFPLGCYLGLCWLMVGLNRLYEWLEIYLYPALRGEVISKLTQHVMRHSHHFYQNQLAGSLGSRINDVSLGVVQFLIILIDRFFNYLLALFIAIYTLFQVSYIFSMLMLGWASFFILFSWYWSKPAKRHSETASEANSHLIGWIVDLFSNASAMRFFATWDYEKGQLSRLDRERQNTEQDLAHYLFKRRVLFGLSYLLLQTTSIAALVYTRAQARISAGDFVLIMTINRDVADYLWSLSRDLSRFADCWGKVLNGARLLLPHDVQDRSLAPKLFVKDAQIQLEKVSFGYDKQPLLFNNLDLIIPAGQKVGLVGYSGSGKSSLAHLLLRLFDLQGGKILIDGQDIAHVTQDSLRQAVAFIPQDPSLFHRSIAENIRYGDLTASDDQVITAAKRAHAHEFIQAIPNGYNSLVGERGVKLSGGQKQRIAIARAFLKRAPIIILDEATSSLDSMTERLIQESLFELMKGKTSIIIAHRLGTLLSMERIVVFDKGKIIQDGSHEVLVAQEGLYQNLWQAQSGGILPV